MQANVKAPRIPAGQQQQQQKQKTKYKKYPSA